MLRRSQHAGACGKTDMGNSDGRFVWYELATRDVERAKSFYTSVVGWGTAAASTPGPVYTQFTAKDIPVAGLMKLPPDPGRIGPPPQWIGFAGVDDVDSTAHRVKQLGGTVHLPPTDIPNVTRFSVIADPQMVVLALVKKPKGGHERSPQPSAPGHVSWHELLTSDGEGAFAFYSALLGWSKAEAQAEPMGIYQQFSATGEVIGGIVTKLENLPWSHWLYYFNVVDLDAAAKRVEAGGGQILYGPVPVTGGGSIVHCADPEGAIFGLIDTPIRVTIGCYSPRS
jgi:predicted enzyme related to lactoylglutathione lyase